MARKPLLKITAVNLQTAKDLGQNEWNKQRSTKTASSGPGDRRSGTELEWGPRWDTTHHDRPKPPAGVEMRKVRVSVCRSFWAVVI